MHRNGTVEIVLPESVGNPVAQSDRRLFRHVRNPLFGLWVFVLAGILDNDDKEVGHGIPLSARRFGNRRYG